MKMEKKSHQQCNQDSGNVEWYTPQLIIEPVRSILGNIDLDPASCQKANTIVMADAIFTKEQNGLDQTWFGNVWMNHPYGKPEQPCKKSKKTGEYLCNKKKCKERGYHIDEYQPGNSDWINKLHKEFIQGNVKKAACITFASTSEDWFKPLLDYPQLFLFNRVKHLNEQLKPLDQCTKSSVVTFFGVTKKEIEKHTKHIGKVKL